MSILIFCPRVNGQTTLAFVNLPEKTAQETQFAFYATSVVDRNLTKDDLSDQFGEEIVALGFGSISLILEPGATALEALMKRESRHRVLTLDLNVRPAVVSSTEKYRQKFSEWVSLIDILRLSQVDMEYLYPYKNIEELLPE